MKRKKRNNNEKSGCPRSKVPQAALRMGRILKKQSTYQHVVGHWGNAQRMKKECQAALHSQP